LSWCDKLASTPAVGFTLDWHFATSHAILQALSPVLDKLVQDNKPVFTVERQEPFNVVFTTNDGFQYSVDPSKSVVSFQHRLKVKRTSGGPPTMELLSHPLPFSQLLPEVSKRLVEATLLLPGAKARMLTRIGIVSTTVVAEDEVPPGIERFIKYIGRPWKGSVDNYNIQIVADLDKTPKWSDRCAHLLVKPEDREQLPTLQFDWQRTFASGRPLTDESLRDVTATAERASLKYLEELAEGSQFDEDIIGGSAQD
jgi:hypothetical protein